jgi:hypothetical protein
MITTELRDVTPGSTERSVVVSTDRSSARIDDAASRVTPRLTNGRNATPASFWLRITFSSHCVIDPLMSNCGMTS